MTVELSTDQGGGKRRAGGWRSSLPHQLRQLGDIGSNPARLVFSQ